MSIGIKNQYNFWQESYFDKGVKKRRRRRKSMLSNLLFKFTILIFLLTFTNYSMSGVNAQGELEFDLNEPTTTVRQSRSSRTKPSRTRSSTTTTTTTSTTATTTQPPQITLAPKTTQSTIQGTSVASSSSHGHTSTQPYHYAHETLNKTHANLFKNWLDVKSNELYQLSMNYSGFKILNETYNLQLREDAKFSWINFTEMIMDISNTISEVLYNKTLIVKNLSDSVEEAFDKYRNDTRRIKESANHVYYDTKSPKTFCDVQEIHNLRAAKQANLTATPAPTTLMTTMTSTPLFSSPLPLTSIDANSQTNSLGETVETTTPDIDPLKNLSNDVKVLNYLKKSELVFDDEENYKLNVNYDSLEFDFVDKGDTNTQLDTKQVI